MTSQHDSLSQIADALNQARILVFGDIILDRFSEGSVARISREAPIPVLIAESESNSLGGAGLVWQNLVSLGLKSGLSGLIGADEAAREIQHLLKSGDHRHAALFVESEWNTPIKHRFLAHNQQLLRVDRGAPLKPRHSARTQAHLGAKRSLKLFQAIILSDYGYGLLSQPQTPKLIDYANRNGILTFVDPRGHDWQPYRGAQWCTPNLQELQQASRSPCQSDEEIITAARSLIREHQIHGLLVTRSEQGMTLVTKTVARHIQTEARDVYDVTGAGDTVIAVFAAALASGAQAVHAARLANLAAGVVVAMAGPVPVNPRALGAAIEHATPGTAAKQVTVQEAKRQIRVWQKAGRTVGFTNGCFDLLHPGHLASFDGARQHCDRLVVGVNSDDSVRRLKGKDRPAQNLSERMALLAALQNVDIVVAFDEDTPEGLIRTLQPDVLVKGEDYKRKVIPGARDVIARGGKVVLIPLLGEHGTTPIIRKIRSTRESSG
ncbi:MAG: bifunctional heptose 7-phosphate kinase/heptose 1-phosphate adenyltransferase [Alphaproteobacteria bacterium]